MNFRSVTDSLLHSCRLVIMTRYPVPGQTKTRLIPALGSNGASQLQEIMTGHTVLQARCCASRLSCDIEVRFDGGSKSVMRKWLGNDLRYIPQGDGDLGKRMLRAFDAAFHEGMHRVVLIGCDCPERNAELLLDAFAVLHDHDLVLGPAVDGGYYLIGLRLSAPFLFEGIEWGTDRVCARTRAIAKANRLRTIELKTLSDVDRPEDLSVCAHTVLRDIEAKSLSIIIPALNEASVIEETVKRALPEAMEVIVADGGSCDRTLEIAHLAGARTLTVPCGRAVQMNTAGVLAMGSLFLLLHADTHLPEGFAAHVFQTLCRTDVTAGAFSLGIDAAGPGFRIVERFANLRSHLLNLPYGDQGLFLWRDTFLRMGGFSSLPVMEDFEFIRRLGSRQRIVTLKQKVYTSSRRWLQLGIWRTTLINQLMVAGYLLGVPGTQLARLYRSGHINKSRGFPQQRINCFL